MFNSVATPTMKKMRQPRTVQIPNKQLQMMRKKTKASVSGREGKFSKAKPQSLVNTPPQNNNYVILQHDTANALFLRNQVAPGDTVTTDKMTFYYYDPTKQWHYAVAMGRFKHNNKTNNNKFTIQAKVKLMIPKRVINNAQVIEKGGNNVAYNRAILSPFMVSTPTYSGLTVVLPPFAATVHAIRSHETNKKSLRKTNVYYDPLEYVLKFRQFVSSSSGRINKIRRTEKVHSPWENGQSPPNWMNQQNGYRYRNVWGWG